MLRERCQGAVHVASEVRRGRWCIWRVAGSAPGPGQVGNSGVISGQEAIEMSRLRVLVLRLLGGEPARAVTITGADERQVAHRSIPEHDRAIYETEMREAARVPVEGVRGIW